MTTKMFKEAKLKRRGWNKLGVGFFSWSDGHNKEQQQKNWIPLIQGKEEMSEMIVKGFLIWLINIFFTDCESSAWNVYLEER